MSTLNRSPNFPPVTALVPHAEAMCLLDTVISADAEQVVCRARVLPGAVFATAGGRVPTWVGAEYLAQAAAAWGGLQRWRSTVADLGAETAGAGAGPEAGAGGSGAAAQGYLTGVRELACHVADFHPGQCLEVRLARGFAMGDAAIWEGEIHDADTGALLVAGSLSLHVAAAAETAPAAPVAPTADARTPSPNLTTGDPL